jgi:TPR repeat protein
MKTSRFFIVVMFLFASAAPVWADDTAIVDSLKKRAVQGEAKAQLALGFTYAEGKLGVPQDYAEALKWFRLAAAQGIAQAQLMVGLMYSMGQGVPQDFVEAHKWLNLAAATYTNDKPNHDRAIKARDIVAADMTPAQIAEAQKLARGRGTHPHIADGQQS